MTISVVQASNSSGVFASGVTPGNTIMLIAEGFDFANTTITTSAPTLGGTAYTGATDLLDIPSGFSTGSGVVYGGFWLLKNIPGGFGGATTTGITFGGGGSQYGLFAYEIAGLGATPTLDQLVHNQNGNALNPASGSTPAITAAPEIIFGLALCLGVGLAAPTPAGWTSQAGSSSFGWAGYQIATSSGGTYSWSQSSGGSGNAWSAGIVTIQGSGGAVTPAPAQPQRQARGRAALRPGRSQSSPGAPVLPQPSPVPAQQKAHAGRPAAVKGHSQGSAGTPAVRVPAAVQPQRAAIRGRSAARTGRSEGSTGAPVTQPASTPSPFTPLRRAARGLMLRVTGRGRGSPGTPVTVNPFHPTIDPDELSGTITAPGWSGEITIPAYTGAITSDDYAGSIT